MESVADEANSSVAVILVFALTVMVAVTVTVTITLEDGQQITSHHIMSY